MTEVMTEQEFTDSRSPEPEHCRVGLVIVERSGRIVAVNREAERLLGRSGEDLLGRDAKLLSLGEPVDRYLDAVQRCDLGVQAQGDLKPFSTSVRQRDGSCMRVRIGLSGMSVGGTSHIVATMVDSEGLCGNGSRGRQLHQMASLGVKTGGLAHDLKNLLHVILAFAELAEEDVHGQGMASDSMKRVVEAARRGQALVNEVLVSAQRRKPIRSQTAVEPAVREAVGMLRAVIPSTIRVYERYRLSDVRSWAGHNELHQIVMNLGMNAAHAIGARGGAIDIEMDLVASEQPAEDGVGRAESELFLRLAVSDTGQGISDHAREHIFEPFFTTKGSGEGSGLGLVVVDGIVRSLGGAIEVRSRVGEGTRFEILLPAILIPEH